LRLATYDDGRPIQYDEGTHTFDVGGTVVTTGQLIEYDRAGQVSWERADLRTWFESNFVCDEPARQPSNRSKKAAVVFIAIVAIFCLFACVGVIGLNANETVQEPASVAAGDDVAASADSKSDSVDTPTKDQTPASVSDSKIDEAAVLEEMRLYFGVDVSGIAVDDKGAGRVRIDVYTTYYPDRDAAGPASGMAKIAAQSSIVQDVYPVVEIEAYVWPRGREFYMTRAAAAWTNGHIDAPMNFYMNDVLK